MLRLERKNNASASLANCFNRIASHTAPVFVRIIKAVASRL
jgi:hypothetical protein